MKLIHAVKAYRAAEKLSYQTGLKRKTSIQVFLLREALKPAFTYNSDEERKILDMHPNFDPRSGGIKAKDGNIEAAMKERDELNQQLDDLHDSEWEIKEMPEKFRISKDESVSSLTPDDIGSLMKFIEFEED